MTEHIAPPKNLSPGSLVWVYLRDSGGYAQELSVPQQKAELIEYCEHYGLVIAHVFADVAKSAGSWQGDAFLDAIEMSLDATLRPRVCYCGTWVCVRWKFAVRWVRHYGMVVHSLTNPSGGLSGLWWNNWWIIQRGETHQTSPGCKNVPTLPGYSLRPPAQYLRYVVLGKKRDGNERKASRWVPDLEIWDMVKLAWQMRADGCAYDKIQKATGRILYRSKNCWPTFFHNKAYLGIGVWGELEIPDHHPAAIAGTWMLSETGECHIASANREHLIRRCCPSLLSGLRCAPTADRISYDITNRHKRFYICGKKPPGAGKHQGRDQCHGRQAVFEALMTRFSRRFLSSNGRDRKRITDTSAPDRRWPGKKALVTNRGAIPSLLDNRILQGDFGSELASAGR
jgi:hypothetical protein